MDERDGDDLVAHLPLSFSLTTPSLTTLYSLMIIWLFLLSSHPVCAPITLICKCIEKEGGPESEGEREEGEGGRERE